ncbi:MAG: DivIVA domain-containing protein [Actinomycetota bacterium]
MLTADDVLALRFPTGNLFVSGYAAESVDRWLERVVTTLRAYEGHPDGELCVLAADARAVRFAARRGKAAYEPDQVDDAIDMIAATLAMHEAAAERSAR